MARKGKKRRKQKKNQKIKLNFNKKEFIEIFCQTCLICKDPDPVFCYLEMYKHEPRVFTYKIYNNLIDTNVHYQSVGRSLMGMSIEQFQNIVCRTGVCFNGDVFAGAGCDSLNDCYKRFMGQMGVVNPAIIHEDACNLISFKNNKSKKSHISYNKGKKRKNRKNKTRVVYTAYPTFFSSQNADFQASIRKILYGDTDKQQNKDKELSAGDSGTAGGDTKD